MTREELLADIDQAVEAFMDEIAQRDQGSSGIPRPPSIVVNQTDIDPQPFNFKVDRGPESTAEAGDGTIGGPSGPPVEPPVHPACDVATLVCRSASGSDSKCGYQAYDGSHSYYLRKDNRHRVECTDTKSCFDACHDIVCGPPGNAGLTKDVKFDCFGYREYNMDCVETTSCSSPGVAGGTGTKKLYKCPGSSADCTEQDATCDGLNGENTCNPCGDSGYSCSPGSPVVCTCSKTVRQCDNGPTHCTSTLSNEYTTEMMISKAKSEISDFSGHQCFAFSDLATDQSSYSFRRTKYKFTFLSPIATTCTISWRIRNYDGDGNCIGDEMRSFIAGPGMSETPEYDLNEPDGNGERDIIYPDDFGAGC